MRFCFYSEYKDLKGGYTTLILTLMKQLYAQGQEVLLINYKDGLIAHELKRAGVIIPIIEKDDIHKRNVKLYFNDSDILIIPRFYEFLKVLFNVNPKVIYYDINDNICQISDYRFRIKLPFFSKRIINKLLAGNGLVFMDDTGINNLEREFGIKVQHPKFLPIAIPDEKENVYLKSKRNLDKEIRLTYIGRSVNWKMYPLKKIIEDCLLTYEKIKFSIVVDNISSFNNFLDVNKYNGRSLSIKVYENLLPSDIRSFLSVNADLHFGMGTTAIHAASIGIPTILMDFSTKPFPEDYSYRWLPDSEFFSLGKNIERVPIPKGVPLKNIFSKIKNSQERNKISEDAFKYVASNHTASNVVDSLIRYSSQCTFRLRAAKNLNPYYFKIHALAKEMSKAFIKNKSINEA